MGFLLGKSGIDAVAAVIAMDSVQSNHLAKIRRVTNVLFFIARLIFAEENSSLNAALAIEGQLFNDYGDTILLFFDHHLPLPGRAQN